MKKKYILQLLLLLLVVKGVSQESPVVLSDFTFLVFFCPTQVTLAKYTYMTNGLGFANPKSKVVYSKPSSNTRRFANDGLIIPSFNVLEDKINLADKDILRAPHHTPHRRRDSSLVAINFYEIDESTSPDSAGLAYSSTKSINVTIDPTQN